jgi:hypothetical protein
VFGKVHVTIGGDSGETIVSVAVKGDLEHGSVWLRAARAA